MNESINRLIIAIAAGFIVTAVGLILKREIKIFDLAKYIQVLRSQIHDIWTDPMKIRAEMPIKSDDFKSFARYLGPLEFVVLMKISSLVQRYYEIAQKMHLSAPTSEEFSSRYNFGNIR